MTRYIKKSKYRNNRGVTAVELLVIVSLLVLLIVVVLPSFSRIREVQVANNSVEDVVAALLNAQSKSRSSLDSSSYGVYFESNLIVVFKGTVYSESAPENEIISIISPANISNVNLGGISGSEGELYFNRLTGTPSKTGTVTITADNTTKVITIGATGSVSTN